MLSAQQVAAALGISRRGVYELNAVGMLRGYRVGRRISFAEADVDAYKLSCRVEPIPRPPRVIYDHRPKKPKPLGKREMARLEAARLFARQTLVAHHAAKRRAERRNRAPPWVDLQAIKALHAEARRLTRATGVPHHVDHVLPLQGALVSGLHVHTNMQILTGVENVRKHNHFEPN